MKLNEFRHILNDQFAINSDIPVMMYNAEHGTVFEAAIGWDKINKAIVIADANALEDLKLEILK